MPDRPYTFDRVVRILITIGALWALMWLVNTLRGVLLPFLVAWLIAYILEPFVQYNRRLLGIRRRRLLPVLVTLFEVALLCWAAGMFVVPSITGELGQVAEFIRQYKMSHDEIAFIPAEFHDFLRETIDLDTLAEKMTTGDIRSLLSTAASFVASGYTFLLGIFNWFIVILYVVFIMIDYDRLLGGLRRLVPPKYRTVVFRIGNDVKDSMNHYFRGQALIATLVGIMFAIGFLIVGLPLAIILGLFIGLLNMVPYLQLISLVPTTLLCLVYSVRADVDFWNIWWACMAVYVIVQCIQDLVLTPKIMGKAMGLNPAIILLSLSVWGTLLGFVGLIIALPLTTLLIAYYDMYIEHRDGESGDEARRDARSFLEMFRDRDAD